MCGFTAFSRRLAAASKPIDAGVMTREIRNFDVTVTIFLSPGCKASGWPGKSISVTSSIARVNESDTPQPIQAIGFIDMKRKFSKMVIPLPGCIFSALNIFPRQSCRGSIGMVIGIFSSRSLVRSLKRSCCHSGSFFTSAFVSPTSCDNRPIMAPGMPFLDDEKSLDLGIRVEGLGSKA